MTRTSVIYSFDWLIAFHLVYLQASLDNMATDWLQLYKLRTRETSREILAISMYNLSLYINTTIDSVIYRIPQESELRNVIVKKTVRSDSLHASSCSFYKMCVIQCDITIIYTKPIISFSTTVLQCDLTQRNPEVTLNNLTGIHNCVLPYSCCVLPYSCANKDIIILFYIYRS